MFTGVRLQKTSSTANRREFTSTCSSVSNVPRGQILARELTHCPLSTARLLYRLVQQNSTLQRSSLKLLLKLSLIRWSRYFLTINSVGEQRGHRLRRDLLAKLIVASNKKFILALRLSTRFAKRRYRDYAAVTIAVNT